MSRVWEENKVIIYSSHTSHPRRTVINSINCSLRWVFSLGDTKNRYLLIIKRLRVGGNKSKLKGRVLSDQGIGSIQL